MAFRERRRVGFVSGFDEKNYCFAARRATFMTVVLDALSLIFLKYLRSLFSSDVRYGITCSATAGLYDSKKYDCVKMMQGGEHEISKNNCRS